jgi:branched-chain amino acid transport system permease protein
MLNTLISGDLPRSRALSLLLVLVVLGLALAPFITSGAKPLNTAATICIYIVLVASYDLLLGYTGIVSFAHTMFFGIGAYGVGLGFDRPVPAWSGMAAGLAAASAPTASAWAWPASRSRPGGRSSAACCWRCC